MTSFSDWGSVLEAVLEDEILVIVIDYGQLLFFFLESAGKE